MMPLMSPFGMEQTGKFLAHLILDISIPLAFAGDTELGGACAIRWQSHAESCHKVKEKFDASPFPSPRTPR